MNSFSLFFLLLLTLISETVLLLQSYLFCSYLPFKISENGEQLNGNFVHVEALAEDVRGTGSITVDNTVILFTVRTSQDRSE